LEYSVPAESRHFLRREDPATNAIIKSTRKTKNKILAIDAAPAAIPVNPNNAAISAIIKNVNDQRNIALFI
jgi:hypothetical protein